MMTEYYIGLGSNLGARQNLLQEAVRHLGLLPEVQVQAVSHMYETPPWGKIDQPPFLNAVVKIRTDWQPEQLCSACQHIEQMLGRVRKEKWGARTIDLDILWGDDVCCHNERLTIPHPYLKERAFALIPLQELAPDLVIDGQAIDVWLEKTRDRENIRCTGLFKRE